LLTGEKSDLSRDEKTAFSRAGLSHIIEVVNEDAQKFVKDYNPDYELDFVFIDADKRAYKKYLEYTTPHLRKGGVVCADNALAFGHLVASDEPEKETKNVQAIREFNQILKDHPDYFTTLVTMGDGMAMGIKQ